MKLRIEAEHRPLGIFIAGLPGNGKSSLVQDLALQDIRAGHGVTVIDPSTDLIDRIAAFIPKEQAKKTILFDTKDPIPIDFFSYDKRNPLERRILTDLLVNIFSLNEAPISKPLTEQVISTMFDANERGGNYGFLDLLRFTTEPDFQSEVISKAQRESDWKHRPKISDFSSIIGRLVKFREFPLKTIFSLHKNPLNIKTVIEQKQILLINLHDTESDYFIASLIASKFQQEIFARDEIDRSERHPYYLYIDECHAVLEYAEKQFATILTRARKFNLCLTLVAPKVSELPKRIRENLDLLQSFYLFQMDYKEAAVFKSRLGRYTPEYLFTLGKFQAVCRTGATVQLVQTPLPLKHSTASFARAIKNRTKDLYGLPDSKDKVRLSQDGNPNTSHSEDEPPTLEPDERKPRHT